MENTKDIDLDVLLQKMRGLCPNLPNNERFNSQLRAKLEEQIKDKVPKVALEQLDLKYIIPNVKNSLSEFKKRIDESIQQQLRRRTRVRKNISHEPSHINLNCRCSNESSSPSTSAKPNKSNICSATKCCHQSCSDLVALVQVESLPVSASTNLVTIFVPTILQEKLHNIKYKISIDLNHLDMTKKILDLNLSQLECNLKKNPKAANAMRSEENQDCKLTYQIKDDKELQLVEENTQSNVKDKSEVEIKVPKESESQTLVESAVCIIKEKEGEIPTTTKCRVPKRKYPKDATDPPKRRGRKPGSKNKTKREKSDLAKYLEMFECNGNSPSAVSQIVTSTTQNWDVLPDQTPQIAYFMNGEWTTLENPVNSVAPKMVTTTNGSLGDSTLNENFIPFDDFVNFIDNQSVDVGNNVIARVLDGAVDNFEEPVNLLEHESTTLGVDNNHRPKDDENSKVAQFTSTRKNEDDIIEPTKAKTNEIAFSNEIQKNINFKETQESNNVIFSTCRSMPSLDIEEEDLFHSISKNTEVSEGIIAFSMRSHGPTRSYHESAFNKRDEDIPDFSLESAKSETLQSNSDSPKKNTLFKAKINNEVVKEMSLLEIEKDFDDSLLNFGDCLDDDLLSLAPSSCFNSPIDDRFADSSFLLIEQNERKSCTKSNISFPVPAPRSYLETSLGTPNENENNPTLKNFKIPRVKELQQTTEISSEKSAAAEVPLKGKNKQTSSKCISYEFSLTSPETLTPHVSSKLNTSAPQVMSSQEICKIFGSLCYNFLVDMCFESNCNFSHQLVDLGIVSMSVSLLSNELLNFAYRFIWRHYKLFKFYFPIFCEEYGRRNMRQKLSTMVRDCQMQLRCAPYLKNIYVTLIGCGFSKVNACRFILSRVGDRSCMTIDVLIAMIIESDAQMFVSTIEEFSTIEGYKFEMKNINDLAVICLRSGSADLVPALIKCLINVDQNEFLKMRSPELIQLLEMIKSSGGK